MMPAKKRPRTIRREGERADAKLVRAREALFALEEGGATHHPIVVESASQIEPHAESLQCPACGDHFLVEDHEVLHREGGSIRVVSVLSRHCGKRRKLYFAIQPALPS
jgi:hypothetical protein